VVQTDTHTHFDTLGRAPLGEGSVYRRDIYLPLQNTTSTINRHPCHRAGFEPAIPSNQRPQTYALESVDIKSIPNKIDILIAAALYVGVVVHATSIPLHIYNCTLYIVHCIAHGNALYTVLYCKLYTVHSTLYCALRAALAQLLTLCNTCNAAISSYDTNKPGIRAFILTGI